MGNSWKKTQVSRNAIRSNFSLETSNFISFFENGPNPASFCLFPFFSQDKYSTNLTLNDKSINGVPRTRTWGGRMVDADETTELLRHPPPQFYFLLIELWFNWKNIKGLAKCQVFVFLSFFIGMKKTTLDVPILFCLGFLQHILVQVSNEGSSKCEHGHGAKITSKTMDQEWAILRCRSSGTSADKTFGHYFSKLWKLWQNIQTSLGAVWPDLAKFRPFSKNLKVLGNFWVCN